ncbi:hypothetical protein D3C71_1672600 [compost metagenome]
MDAFGVGRIRARVQIGPRQRARVQRQVAPQRLLLGVVELFQHLGHLACAEILGLLVQRMAGIGQKQGIGTRIGGYGLAAQQALRFHLADLAAGI